MKRAAIYARFSTDLQNERSIEDQVALCRAYAAREGFAVVTVYEDRARSGGSLLGRDGAAALMRDAAAGKFHAVIVEALDRLSRDMEDLAGIYKRLSFAEVELKAVHEGAVDDMLIGLRGLFGQYFRKDLKDKIRRGMAGRVRDGLVQSGVAYGYSAVAGQSGARAIVEAEAAIVRRIFQEYVDGAPPREIARRLNADGIPAQRGGKWNAASINGNATHGGGILRNQLYIGRFIWGRTRKVMSPATGRNVRRVGGADAQVTTDLPDLAIVPRALFDNAAARKLAMAGVQPSHQRQRKHLLSGLLRCAGCDGRLHLRSNWQGRKRIDCGRRHVGQDCPDPRSFSLLTVERAVLGGLQAELRQPAAIAEFARIYREERVRLAATSAPRRADIERNIEQTQRRLDRVITCIADGHGDPAVLGPQTTALYREIGRLRAELAAIEAEPPIAMLHTPGIDRYQHYVEHLTDYLAAGPSGLHNKAADAIRSLIETVTVRHGGARGKVHVRIKGRLAALVDVRGKTELEHHISHTPHLTGGYFIIEAAA